MKRGVRIVGYIVLAVIILYFGGQWWLEGKIRRTIESKVSEMTQGAVKADIGAVSVRLIGRAVWLKEVKITTDTAAIRQTDLPVAGADIYLDKLGIRGIHYNKKDSTVHIRAKEFELKGPHIRIASLKKEKKANPTNEPTTRKLDLQIQNINILLDEIQYEKIQERDTNRYTVKDLHAEIQDYEMQSDVGTSRLPFLCRNIDLSFTQFQNQFAERSQLLEIDTLNLRGKEGTFSVGSVRLLPQYAKYEFAQKAPGHVDWTRIETGKLYCSGVDMQRMLTKGVLVIDSVSLQQASIASYKNRQIEQVQKVKRLFYESVQEFPVPLAIRRITLNNIGVEYQELAKKGFSPGKITFEGLHGMFYGLTNIVQADRPYFTLKAQGKLMGQGQIQATFRLPVDSLNPHFEVEGKLGSMSLLDLNPMIEPLAKIKITSGEEEEMTFRIEGNSHKAHINMVFLYQDLKIRIMKEKDGHLETRSFLTTLANGLIAKGNNPDHGGIRRVEGEVERDPYRSQFNYLWKTLFEGLKKSVGL